MASFNRQCSGKIMLDRFTVKAFVHKIGAILYQRSPLRSMWLYIKGYDNPMICFFSLFNVHIK